ncbi:hypothetical protein B566_EDAN008143 [Ephemera danica]|nr:hypothetical protein B566_EDAN008143 [Ephemera danica]
MQHHDVSIAKQPLKQINCNSGYLLRGFVNSSRGVSAKRKSAVELLQESKAFYVKSEHVLDKKQELKNSGHLHVTSPAVDLFLRAPANGCGGGKLSSSPPSAGHQRAMSLDKAAFNSLPPRLPERSGSHSPPPLPPKSPRVAAVRPRARTVTEIRRSHSHADDVQMKLRRLLSSSSSVEPGQQVENKPRRAGPRYRRLLDDEDDDEDAACLELELSLGELERAGDCCFDDSSPPFDSKTVAGERVYLRSRHSTPTAHTSRSLLSPATHKSLPDLSPMVRSSGATVAVESTTTTPGSDEETSGASSGRHRSSRYSPRATSDYASRSPSSCKCCRAGGRSAPCSEAGSAPARAALRSSPTDDDDFSVDSGDSVTGACRTTTDSRRSSPRAESQPGGPRSPSPSGTRRRPILRSKSDISHRYSRAAFLAPIVRTVVDEMEDTSPLSPPVPQPRRSSADIERFFEQLGLEDDTYKLMTSKRGSRDSSASPVFFESVSSVDSWPGTWGGEPARGAVISKCDIPHKGIPERLLRSQC